MLWTDLSAWWVKFGPSLGNRLWQATLFAVAAGPMTLALRNSHARARCWLWLAASAKLLVIDQIEKLAQH